MVAMPKMATDTNILAPTFILDGSVSEKESGGEGPDCGCAAQKAQPHRTDMQYVARKDGKQRRGAAQQHREQIQ